MEWKALLLMLTVVCGELRAAFNESDSVGSRVLSRRKRFLLFPPGSNILLTSFFGKGLVFRGPAGYVVIGELDLYYPLPDYKYHASALKLGKIAMYPPEPKKPPPPAPPTTAKPAEHHHDGGELTPAEVQEYLKAHPNTWIPPGWGKERADWNTYGAYGSEPGYDSGYWRTGDRGSGTLNRYLGANSWNEAGQPYGRFRRSVVEQALENDREDDHARSRWLSGEAFNISQHGDWEHFHHYRDRRALFSHLEDTIGAITGFHMKECILRSICEAKNMLPPPGRSMAMDIFRVLFSFPLREDLTDDYSSAMRDDATDCRARYGAGCPASLLDLVLFGRFEP
ncbi:uncharacterized protein LOC128721966 [Anopheles nili]|uniref:uncharacterized protein LOC128721966 n=1 Tax=Anopheles nili TaxID=185578 RepID=UPI00237A538A|nr:uncharacterized protein LOC128721966 [Anopheles nili]